MSSESPTENRLKSLRVQRGWSQETLAEAAGISRAAVSAIEIGRIVPSVAAAISLANALACSVEDIFAPRTEPSDADTWAWSAPATSRYWRAEAGKRIWSYPTESTAAGYLPHDGVFREGRFEATSDEDPRNTLVMASCDPAVGLLADAYRRQSGYRLLPLPRSSGASLDLLRRGLVDVAGIHLASTEEESGNSHRVREMLGEGFSLLRFAAWEEGLATANDRHAETVAALVRAKLHWVGRESGSGARQCQDEILGARPAPRRFARDHRGVAEAIRNGWADVGVCLKLVCAEAGLRFIGIREESYDLCFRSGSESEPRIRSLIRICRDREFRSLLSDLPGYRTDFFAEIATA